MDKLKPCPFCGGEVNVHSSSDAFSSPFFEIYCPQCYTSMRYYINVLETDEHNKEGIVQRWNTRASDWHTGTPTEEGRYLCVLESPLDEPFYVIAVLRKEPNRIVWQGNIEPLAWQKITPYQREKEK